MMVCEGEVADFWRVTYHPKVTVFVPIAEQQKCVAIDGRLSGLRANGSAYLVRKGDTLVARSARYELRTLSLEPVEFVHRQTLKPISVEHGQHCAFQF